MANKQLKLLVSGDVEGKLAELYSKIDMIQSKAGNFDMLFCVGEFFNDTNAELNEYIAKRKSAPIMTYILGTTKSVNKIFLNDENGCEICDRIIYLGRKGQFKTKEGLKLTYLAGVDKSLIKKSELESYVAFDEQDVTTLEGNNQSDGVDVLLTNQWPKYIEQHAQQLENNTSSETFGSELVSRLAFNLKPRYHFSGSQDVFYERKPYYNTKVYGNEMHISRFIALAKVNKKNKPKFLYAFNLVPMCHLERKDLIQHGAAEVSQNPYVNKLDFAKIQASAKRPHDEPSLQYFYDPKQMDEMNKLNKKHRGDNRGANDKVSIGKKCYLAYAKGALNADHLLILPINHVQSTIKCDDEILEDLNAYKNALIKYYKQKNKCVVFYERNFRTQHFQIQVFALPEQKSFLIKDAFQSAAIQQSVELNEIPKFTNLKQVLEANQQYFYLELPADEERYLCEIQSRDFPINFGRDVIASETLLDLPERIDWKQCILTEEQEKQMSKDFRVKFTNFDPASM